MRGLTREGSETILAVQIAELRGREVEDLKRQLERERERLDWWAKHSLDTCVRVQDRRFERIHPLDEGNIRAAIDSARRREAVWARELADG